MINTEIEKKLVSKDKQIKKEQTNFSILEETLNILKQKDKKGFDFSSELYKLKKEVTSLKEENEQLT